MACAWNPHEVAEAQDSVFTPKMSKLYLIITQGAIANPRKSGKKDRLSSTLWHIPKDLARLTEGVESLYYCTENIYAILLSALAREKANKKIPIEAGMLLKTNAEEMAAPHISTMFIETHDVKWALEDIDENMGVIRLPQRIASSQPVAAETFSESQWSYPRRSFGPCAASGDAQPNPRRTGRER